MFLPFGFKIRLFIFFTVLNLIKLYTDMGKVYKDKKSKGCALCKPHKHGWTPKKKAKVIAIEKEMEKEALAKIR